MFILFKQRNTNVVWYGKFVKIDLMDHTKSDQFIELHLYNLFMVIA